MEESVTMSKLSYDSIGVNVEKLRSENAALKAELAALKESTPDQCKGAPCGNIFCSGKVKDGFFHECRAAGGFLSSCDIARLVFDIDLLVKENENLKNRCGRLVDGKIIEEALAKAKAELSKFASKLAAEHLEGTYETKDTLCIFFPERTADIKRIVINGREEPVEGLERLLLDVEALVDRPRVTVERRK